MSLETSKEQQPNRQLRWLVLPLALALFLVWSNTASAAELSEHPKPEPGILVTGVRADGPAAEAGVARGDILMAVDGDSVNTSQELRVVIMMHEPGDTVDLTVMHGDEERTLTVTLGDNEGRPMLGLATHDPRSIRQGRQNPRQDHRQFVVPGRGPQSRGGGQFFGRGGPQGFGGPFGQRPFEGMPFEGMPFGMMDGAVIMGVMEDGPAAAAGLQEGDRITAVDETEVASFDALATVLAAHSPGDEVEVTVDRGGESVTVSVTLGAHPDDEDKAYLGVQIGQVHMERFRNGPRDGKDRDKDSRDSDGERNDSQDKDSQDNDSQGNRIGPNRFGLRISPGQPSQNGPMRFFFGGGNGGSEIPFEFRPFQLPDLTSQDI